MKSPPFVREFITIQRQQGDAISKIHSALTQMGYKTTRRTVYNLCKRLDEGQMLADKPCPGRPSIVSAEAMYLIEEVQREHTDYAAADLQRELFERLVQQVWFT